MQGNRQSVAAYRRRMRRKPEEFGGLLLHHGRWSSLGFHARDLASESFTTVFPGYRTPTDHPASLDAMAWVLQNRVQAGSVLSHTTAALLWGIPFPLGLDEGIAGLGASDPHVVNGVAVTPAVLPGASLRSGARLPLLHCRVERGGTSGVGRGARVHRLRAGPTSALGKLTVSSIPETVRELATMMPLWDVVAAVDAVIGLGFRHPGQTIGTLTAAAEAARGLHGTPRTLAALRLARPRVRSPGETLLRLVLERVGFPEPSLNHPVQDPDSEAYREIDLAWEDFGLGLEYDGDGHRTTKEQWRRDEVRRDELASRGWTLARANGDDLFRPLRILLRLRRTMRERGAVVPSEVHIRRAVLDIGASELSLRIAHHQR